MNATPMQNDSGIWKKGAAANPEVVQLISEMQIWDMGKTYDVALDKPVKSLGVALRRAFGDTKNISVKKKDDTFKAWYVRVDLKTSKTKTNKIKNVKVNNKSTTDAAKSIPETTGQPTSN